MKTHQFNAVITHRFGTAAAVVEGAYGAAQRRANRQLSGRGADRSSAIEDRTRRTQIGRKCDPVRDPLYVVRDEQWTHSR